MTTVSPCLDWTACTAPHAVAPATNRPPAASPGDLLRFAREVAGLDQDQLDLGGG